MRKHIGFIVAILVLLSASNSQAEPETIKGIENLKIWILSRPSANPLPGIDNGACEVDFGDLLRPIYEQVTSSKKPKMEFWTDGQPEGPALAITITSSALPGSDSFNPQCVAVVSYVVADFHVPKVGGGAPVAERVWDYLPNMIQFGAGRSIGKEPGADDISRKVAGMVAAIISNI